MNSKSKWIVDRLKRRGYALASSSNTVVWMWLSLKSDGSKRIYDACSLHVKVDDATHLCEAKFRPLLESYIHVTAYMMLRYKLEWKRLEEFERLYARYGHEMHIPEQEKCLFCGYVGSLVPGRTEGMMACASCGAQ